MVQFPVASPTRSATLSATKRVLFPARYVRKDARTLARRMTYGPQSNLTAAIIMRPGMAMGKDRNAVARQIMEETLAKTGYDPSRCRKYWRTSTD